MVGHFLVAEPDRQSIEPDYQHHKFTEKINIAKTMCRRNP